MSEKKLFSYFVLHRPGLSVQKSLLRGSETLKKSIPFSSITGSRKKDISAQCFRFLLKIQKEALCGTEISFLFKKLPLRQKTGSTIFC